MKYYHFVFFFLKFTFKEIPPRVRLTRELSAHGHNDRNVTDTPVWIVRADRRDFSEIVKHDALYRTVNTEKQNVTVEEGSNVVGRLWQQKKNNVNNSLTDGSETGQTLFSRLVVYTLPSKLWRTSADAFRRVIIELTVVGVQFRWKHVVLNTGR